MRLIPVTTYEDIPENLRGTPIGDLLEYHNLDRPPEIYTNAKLLIGMCMDSREHLHIPRNFAFIIRAGGANLRPAAFKVAYAIAVGGVKSIALIGHDDCGMVNLVARKDQFINGMVQNAGWTRERAEAHFEEFAHTFEIGNERAFVLSEAQRIRAEYPGIQVAPMIFIVGEGKLYLLKEG